MSATPRSVVTGGSVLLPEGRLAPRDVVIEDGKILTLEPPGSASRLHAEVVDATACVVAPGLVDTHVHGGLGANFMAGTDDAMRTISRRLAAHGVTSCVATTASTDHDTLLHALGRIADLCGSRPGGVELLGIHLEGPFLSPAYRGVHAEQHVRSPTRRELDELWEVAGRALRVVTLAPEVPGGMAALELLVDRGVIVSVGHSGADYAQTRTAIAAGARRATHLYNGLPPLHHRRPGPVLALLEAPDVHLEVVADGEHVAAEVLRATTAVAGRDRVVVVSDGTDVAGLPDGPQRRWEGTEVVLSGDTARTRAGGVAGSVVPLLGGVRVLVERCGVPLADALTMASATAAASVGASSKGSLAPGYDADLVLLDPDLSVVRTVARGRTIHQKGSPR